MAMSPDELTWRLGVSAQGQDKANRKEFGEDDYKSMREAMRRYLCGYFDANQNCNLASGKSIRPFGGGLNSYKRLKVRFNIPGCGSSGGIRFIASVDCSAKVVLISALMPRSQDASDDVYERAAEESERSAD